LALVHIIDFHKQLGKKLYAGGSVVPMPVSEPVESKELLDLIHRYQEDFDQDFPGCCEPGKITRQEVIKALNLSSDDKYRFASLPDGEKKEQYLASQLRYLRMIRLQETMLDNDFGLN
jgi:hypothetical protein